MGRNLHYTIPRYLEAAMDKHTKVNSWKRVDDLQDDDDFLYLIKRTSGLSDVLLHASDEYSYSLTDYYQRPKILKAGAFILLARPEAKYDYSIVEIAMQEKISIGKFGAVMGALFIEEHWGYTPKERRKEN